MPNDNNSWLDQLNDEQRRAVTHMRSSGLEDSFVVPYLNRLADYLYVLARSAEAAWVPSKPEEAG